MTEKLAHNDIVYVTDHDDDWSPYGRVWRRVDGDSVEVIFTDGVVVTLNDNQLTREPNYRGCWISYGAERLDAEGNDIRPQKWSAMPNLRHLKQKAGLLRK